jgi:electron transport complex protein RnfB
VHASLPPEARADAVDAIDAALPQTQCTRCGYPDCRSYAQAIAAGEAPINQCPPGGAEGVARLARITGQAAQPLNPAHGAEGPLRRAVIDEAWCIGCTLCLKACPVDSILGGAKVMHTVIDALCTGCELCIPVCPVDCISPVDASEGRTGWDAWSEPQAEIARERYAFHVMRLARDAREGVERRLAKAQSKLAELPTSGDDTAVARKRSVVEAAIARARAQRGD